MERILLVNLINWVFTALWWIIIADIILTWIPSVNRYHPIVVAIRRITEPMYKPLRKAIPAIRMGDVAFDISPIILIIGLQIIQSILNKLILPY